MNLNDKLIKESAATFGWLQKTLQGSLKTEGQLKSCQIEVIGEKMGFMAKLIKVSLQWDDANKTLPKSFVVKLPTSGKAMDALEASNKQSNDPFSDGAVQGDMLIKMMHTNECKIYNWLMPEPPISVPKIYHIEAELLNPETPAAIIMQDLTKYTIVDIIDGFNRNQLMAIAEMVATLHAHTIGMDSAEWMKTLNFEDQGVGDMWPQMVAGMSQVLKQIRPDLFAENLDKIIQKRCGPMYELEKWVNTEEMYPVLAHGDLWATNLLWDGDKLMSVIDWQAAHPSTPTEDLLRVMVTCLPVEFRHQITPDVLQFYYQKLTEKLDKALKTIPFSFNQLMAYYKKTLPYTATTTIFATVMWLNSPVVEGPDKDHRINELMQRTHAIIEETLAAEQQ